MPRYRRVLVWTPTRRSRAWRAADSGVSGDPAKATAEIGKMGVEFKVNAGIAQYKQLKNPAQGRGRGREGQ